MKELPFPVQPLTDGFVLIADKPFAPDSPITEVLFGPNELGGWQVQRGANERVIHFTSPDTSTTVFYDCDTGTFQTGEQKNDLPTRDDFVSSVAVDPRHDAYVTWIPLPLDVYGKHSFTNEIDFYADGSLRLFDQLFDRWTDIDEQIGNGQGRARRTGSVLELSFAMPSDEARQLHFWFFCGTWCRGVQMNSPCHLDMWLRNASQTIYDLATNPFLFTLAVVVTIALGTLFVLRI